MAKTKRLNYAELATERVDLQSVFPLKNAVVRVVAVLVAMYVISQIIVFPSPNVILLPRHLQNKPLYRPIRPPLTLTKT